MNADDTLYGRIKNGVLTLSGNNSSIRVDGGCLVISDGPTAVPANHQGAAAPLEQRMVTQRFRRADCPIERIIVTRPDGFITFSAIKWLHGVGAGLMQLDWDGTVLLATIRAGTDQPALRRAQAMAYGDPVGHAIMREILHAKLDGQARVARLLGSDDTGALIDRIAGELDHAGDTIQLMATEATAAVAYWSLWPTLPLRFARRHDVPEHWQTIGPRRSPLSGKPRKAGSPGQAMINYLYAVLSGEMTIALTSVGLDPGIGIFHADAYRRASLSYDAMETLRPYVDAWLVTWLSTARFSKRDFYEEADGTIRLTRPLTSNLAMTASLWRPAAQAIAGWLAQALAGPPDGEHRRPPPLPDLPRPRRAWQGLPRPVTKACFECGKALLAKQLKFCSEACIVSFHLATSAATELSASSAYDAPSESLVEVGSPSSGGVQKNRRQLALRRAWDLENTPGEGLSRTAEGRSRGSAAGREQLLQWFATTLAPLLAVRRPTEIQRATGLSLQYASMIRQGYVPHPRHYPVLAELCRVSLPT